VSQGQNIRRSTNTPVTIHHAGGETTMEVNQQEMPEHDKLFRTPGTFRFNARTTGWVRISNEGTDGEYVVVDAVDRVGVPRSKVAQFVKLLYRRLVTGLGWTNPFWSTMSQVCRMPSWDSRTSYKPSRGRSGVKISDVFSRRR